MFQNICMLLKTDVKQTRAGNLQGRFLPIFFKYSQHFTCASLEKKITSPASICCADRVSHHWPVQVESVTVVPYCIKAEAAEIPTDNRYNKCQV